MPHEEYMIKWFEGVLNILKDNDIVSTNTDNMKRLKYIDSDGNIRQYDLGKESEIPLEKKWEVYNLAVNGRFGIETDDSKIRFIGASIMLDANIGEPVSMSLGASDEEQDLALQKLMKDCSAEMLYRKENNTTWGDGREANALKVQNLAAVYYIAAMARKNKTFLTVPQIIAQAEELAKTNALKAAVFKQDKDFFKKLGEQDPFAPAAEGEQKAFDQIANWVQEYSKNINADSEFERLSIDLDPEKKEDAKKEFKRLWSINQCIKDIDYSKGKSAEELYGICTDDKYTAKFALHDDTQNMLEQKRAESESYRDMVGEFDFMPAGIKRSYWFMMDHSGTEEAKKHNQEAAKMLQSLGPEATEFKRKFVTNGINKMLNMKDEIFFARNEEDAAKHWKEHYFDYQLIFETKNAISTLKNDFDIPDYVEEALKHKEQLYETNMAPYLHMFKAKLNPDHKACALLENIDPDFVSKMADPLLAHNLEPTQKKLVIDVMLSVGLSNIRKVVQNTEQQDKRWDEYSLGPNDIVTKPSFEIGQDKLLTDKVNAENANDRQKFGQFEEELTKAAKVTYHDSGEYKKIMGMLRKFKEKVDFSKAPGDGPKQWRKLDENQKQALPMLMLKCAINDYIDHKAADGVKVKDYEKLASIERLNQFVSGRLQMMRYTPFKFNGVTYNKNNPQTYVSYKQELNAARQAAEHGAPVYMETTDTSTERSGDAKMKNYSACMDRIMLAKQKKLVEKIKGCTNEALGKGIDSLLEVRSDTLSNVIEARNKTAEKKNSVKL